MDASSRFDDEISLVDLWNLMVRRRWWVISVVLVCFLAGMIHVFMTKRVYASSVDMTMAATFPPQRPYFPVFVTPPEALAKSLMSKQDITGGRRIAWVAQTRFSGKGRDRDSVLSIDVRGDSPEGAHRFAQTLATAMVAQQNSVIDHRRQQLSTYRQNLEANLASAREVVQRLSGKHVSGSIPARAKLVIKARLIQTSSALQTKIADTERQASPIYLRDAQIVSGPTIERTPVEPKTTLVLSAALFGGLMLGMLIAGFGEFLAHAKARANS